MHLLNVTRIEQIHKAIYVLLMITTWQFERLILYLIGYIVHYDKCNNEDPIVINIKNSTTLFSSRNNFIIFHYNMEL